jgi:hypothetical protein
MCLLFIGLTVCSVVASAGLASAETIRENFNNGSWNPSNFVVSGPAGAVVDGAYSSQNADRSILRTVRQYYTSNASPLTVSATLSYALSGDPDFPAVGEDIAFLGTRSSGFRDSNYSNEPLNSLYLRIHNFNDGYTSLAAPHYNVFELNFGDAFYLDPVRVTVVDYGNYVVETFRNTVTNETRDYGHSTSYSSGFGYVVFSGGDLVRWDDIQITGQVVPTPGAAAVFGLGAVLASGRRRRR